MRPRLFLICFALLAAALPGGPAHAQSAQTSLTDRGQIYIFREVSESLVCQCGCNMILHVCNHVNCPSATPLRAEIEDLIRDGKQKDEIVAHFVAKHGEVIRSSPSAEGFNLAAWVTPFVMLVLGAVFVGSFLGARRRRAAAAAAVAASSEPNDYAARVDAELGEFEKRK